MRIAGLFAPLVALLLPTVAAAAAPVQHWTLDNGAEVYFVESESLPIVDIRLTFDAASSRDGDLPGLARLTNNLLDQGSGDLDAGAIAQRLDTLGARLSSGSERDMAWLTLRSLAEPDTLEPALETLARIVGAADFPEQAFEREKTRMLVNLQAVKQSPSALGKRAFYRALYGDHPYATPPSGNEESVARIARDDVIDFHRRHYVAGNAVIAIVGAIDRDQAERLARQLGTTLPTGSAPPSLPEVKPLAQAEAVHVPFDSTQTHVLIGQPAIDRDSDDIYAFTVGNHILGGGGLVSLLTSTMRDQHGLSYSTSSSFVPSARPGPFTIGTQVRSESTAEAIAVLRETFADFLRQGPTEEQLNLAVRNITGGFPLSLDSNSKILGYLSMIGFYDLPLDYLDTFPQRIGAVTAEDVRAALQRHLDPDRLVTVMVGPKTSAEDDAAAAATAPSE